MNQRMTAASPNITIHMVASLDGYIASRDGDISWMQSDQVYERGVQLSEEQVNDFLNTIDCYIMGSRTYMEAMKLGWPYGDTPVVVLSRQNMHSDREQVEYYTGDVRDLFADHLSPRFKNIWVVGGAQTAHAFLDAHLVDKIVITIAPVILGGGIPFFQHVCNQVRLHLDQVTAFRDGMAELSYRILKE